MWEAGSVLLNAGSVIATSISVLRNEALSVYGESLRDLELQSSKKLRLIEPGAFNGLNCLRTISIKQAPLLKTIPDGVFHGMIPHLKILKIVQSALEVVPNMSHLQTRTIITMIDFDSNRIRHLPAGAVEVKADIMNLGYNLIEEVRDWAFHGSQIATLSLRGNKRLHTIGNDALTGLQNLRKLDLSETSITNLPTKGLEELEVLKLADTFTLKSFPSVLHFKYIKEAHLTYPYHCCAFKFPATHHPQEYARYRALQEDMERRYCAHATTPATFIPHRIGPSTTLAGVGVSLLRKIRQIARRWLGDQQDDSYGKFVYTASEHSNATRTNWDDALADVLRGGSDSAGRTVQTGFGRMSDQHEEPEDDHPERKVMEGYFHRTTVSLRPEVLLQAFCGDFAKKYRDVQCYPEPDAFNPCEDVMGNAGLRVAVWFVVVAAVLGNLAVMAVLMSSRFTMSVSKFLMCNLAFADLCMGAYLLIIAAVDVHTIGVYFNYAIDWQHGTGCKVAGFMTVFASELSIFTLTVITLERWYAITYAIHLNKRLKLGTAARTMACGWLYAVAMATLPLMGISGYTKTSICLPVENKDAADMAYLTALLSINGLAFLLICGCYGKMYLSIARQHSNAVTSDMTVAKRMAMLVFTDFACWAPIAFFGLTAVAGYPLINVTNSKILLVFFYPLNSCANPFLYAILTKQYRRDFFILLSRYGFCTQRAMKYKGTYSCHNRYVSTRSLQYPQQMQHYHLHHHRGSLFTQISFENGNRAANDHIGRGASIADDSLSSCADVIPDIETTYEIVRLADNGSGGSRRLSMVREDRSFSRQSDERSSSPFHRGSPHPIKNSLTKLNVHSLEQQEQILKRVLQAPNRDDTFDCDSDLPLWSRTSSSTHEENSGFVSSPVSNIDTEI